MFESRIPRAPQLVLAGLELKAATRGLTPAERREHERLAMRLAAMQRAADAKESRR